MTAFTNYAENAIMDHARGGTAWTQPTGLWAQLHTGDPGEAGTANVAGESTRQSISFPAAVDGVLTNDADVGWLNVSTTEVYTHVSIHDAVTAGNPIMKGPLSASKSVDEGDDFTIPSGSLSLTVS